MAARDDGDGQSAPRPISTPIFPQWPSAFPSIWAFIVADCISFGIFFAVFMSERVQRPALFDASAHVLDARLGLLNTLILITGSWLVALAGSAVRRGDIARGRRLMFTAILVSAGFGAIKIFEYADKLRHGITPLTNDFFSFYFILTGVHFLHYIVGMIVLAIMATLLRDGGRSDARAGIWMQSGAIYWHMVDLLWVFLFPMIYLLGAL